MNTYPYCQEQKLLLPPSVKDLLPDGHLALLINDVVEILDLSCLYRKVPSEGHPSYHPKMMLKVLIYAYCTGTFGSRKIANALRESVPFIYLAAWQTPDFRTISDFRKNNLEEFYLLFKQVVDVCNRLGMVNLGHLAIDGTKIKANASDAKTYDEKRIKKEIDALIKKAIATDAQEDSLYGSHTRGDEVPAQIRDQKQRVEKLKTLKDTLVASGKKKINSTDPDACFMNTTAGIKTSYNAQAAVDEAHMVITANDVVTEESDVKQLMPMVDQTLSNSGKSIQQLSADAGYSSGKNLHDISENGIDAYIPDPEFYSHMRKGKDLSQEHPFHKMNFSYDETQDVYTCPAGKLLRFRYYQKREGKEPLRMYRCSDYKECAYATPCTKGNRGRTIARYPHEEQLGAMRKKLSSAEGKAIYKKRRQLAEPVFGIIKSAMGFRSFLLRGISKVKGEFNLVSIAFDIRKISTYVKKQGNKPLQALLAEQEQAV
jgi:transposase